LKISIDKKQSPMSNTNSTKNTNDLYSEMEIAELNRKAKLSEFIACFTEFIESTIEVIIAKKELEKAEKEEHDKYLLDVEKKIHEAYE
jgi:hypothetical protein